MFDKVFGGLIKNVQEAEIFKKKFSRRDFLKSTGFLVALLSVGNVAGAFTKPQTVNTQVAKSNGGYGNSGYGA